MKKATPIIAFSLLAVWIILLSVPFGKLPPLGSFLSPGTGFWANAEKVESPENNFHPLSADTVLERVTVIFDKRLVPHIRAQNDYDLYYSQGYVQAYYRLWQMDMQTRAAAGRISEIIGKSALNFDRHQRRKGMVWAAERSLKAMQEDSRTKIMLNAYTAGVNAFIHSLSSKTLPLGYKLMNFRPEDWTPLKCALLMKYMADDLTGHSDDIAMSFARQALSEKEFDLLFPDKMESSMPVIPRGTAFSKASLARPSFPENTLFATLPEVKKESQKAKSQIVSANESGIGSNNWALAGAKTVSGYPILCNDPHLSLNLPSIWFESQLTAPGINCYGVSIPGAPGIVIGFNNHISWGMTNNYRDVKDYFLLKTDSAETHYLLDGKEIPFQYSVEKIVIKGSKTPFTDTVRYARQGSVEYDKHFPGPSHSGLCLAMCWMAHRGTNELLALYLLNRADNYSEFVRAIQHFECPAQNFIYADVAGNIAIWGQGRFVNKWPEQGKFVMRGDTSATLWGENIPMKENPHILNPNRNFLESANQQVTDSAYPYYYNGDFTEFRSWEISLFLTRNKKFSIRDMMALQNNNWSVVAYKLMPLFKKYDGDFSLKFPEYSNPWNDTLTPTSRTGAAFQIWWNCLYQNLWKERLSNLPLAVYPTKEITLNLILTDTFLLQKITHVSFARVVKESFRQTIDSLQKLRQEGKRLWYQIKNTSVTHLAKIPAFSYSGLKTGGSGTTINAMRDNHGPSWRMIVSMQPGKIEAWCTYPGGQSGNPGSPFYNSFLRYWVQGKYYRIQFFP